MGDTAGELPDHLHFLGLPKLFFRPLSLLYFSQDRGVRRPQFSRPGRDTLLKGLIEPPKPFFTGFSIGNV
jgi:hypothetical protein